MTAGPADDGSGGDVNAAAIAGLGMTELGKVYGPNATEFAAEAVRLACADAGLALGSIDGLLISSGLGRNGVDLSLRTTLGLTDLGLAMEVNAFGASAGAMVGIAAQAIAAGQANAVACVFADAPLRPAVSSGSAYSSQGRRPPSGFAGYRTMSGLVSANLHYALAAQRHMSTYGTTSEQLGAIAVAQREWAAMNPRAAMRDRITLDEHQTSRMIAAPLHLLDCCLVSNGAIAVIVTGADRAADLNQPAVHVWGYGQRHVAPPMARGSDFGLRTGAVGSGRAAMRMAGVSVGDIDLVELYDCYTFTVLITLEDYGFCNKGEGGAFVADGRLAPGGELPCNTGGGQLSSFYMWGMTPLSEAVIQARHQAGSRQVDKHDVILVSGNGGVLEHHSTLVLSPHRKQR
jgi:acetyl-CoA acetyltransferase